MLKPEHIAAINDYISSHDGKPLNKHALLHANPVIAKALVARIASMTPDQATAIKGIVTPQSAEALKILLPELSELIDKGVTNGAG